MAATSGSPVAGVSSLTPSEAVELESGELLYLVEGDPVFGQVGPTFVAVVRRVLTGQVLSLGHQVGFVLETLFGVVPDHDFPEIAR